MSQSEHNSYSGLLWFGIFLLCLAIAGTLTGEAVTRGRIIDRADDPHGFKWAIASLYIGGLGSIGAFLLLMH